MADDVEAAARVHLSVTDDELRVAHNGRSPTDAEVHGVCGLGANSKAGTDGGVVP